VLAAKAADKLLSVRDVRAAFALILIGDTVYVSARSDGSINVQLITERIGGGGHFDAAGAALADSSIKEAEELLKKAIDDYFENLTEEEN
jgi:c-di-AMP phosphodiesterase-like protein